MCSALFCCMSVHVEVLNPVPADILMLSHKRVRGHSLTVNGSVVNKKQVDLPVLSEFKEQCWITFCSATHIPF